MDTIETTNLNKTTTSETVNKEDVAATNSKTTSTNTPEQVTSVKAEDVKPKNLDLDEYTKEFAEHGSLSNESYAKLEEYGFTKNTIDTYIEGRRSQADNQTKELTAGIGGVEEYKKMSEWATKNLPAQELQNYNSALGTADDSSTKLIIQGLYSKYKSAVKPTTQPLKLTGHVSTGGISGYASNAEMLKEMSNPDYAKDPSFRAKVYEKVRQSPHLFDKQQK